MNSRISKELTGRTTAAPAVRVGLASGIDAAIARQLGRVRRREFTPLGVLERLQIEASGVALLQGNRLVGSKTRTAALDWYKTGPLIGVSEDQQEILVCSPMLRPPPIPDPDFAPIYQAPGYKVLQQGDGNTVPTIAERSYPEAAPARLLAQKLEELAAGVLASGAGEWLVFQPIHQMLLLSRGGRQGFTQVTWSADSHGRHCALLYHPGRGQAHFLCGRPEIVSYEGRGPSKQLWEGAWQGAWK